MDSHIFSTGKYLFTSGTLYTYLALDLLYLGAFFVTSYTLYIFHIAGEPAVELGMRNGSSATVLSWKRPGE